MNIERASALEANIFSGHANHDFIELLKEYDGDDEFNAHRIHSFLAKKYASNKKNIVFYKSGEQKSYVKNANYTYIYINQDRDFFENSIIDIFGRLLNNHECGDVIITRTFDRDFPNLVSVIKDLCCAIGRRVVNLNQKKNEINKFFEDQAKDARNLVEQSLAFPGEIILPTLSGPCNVKCRFCEQAYVKVPYKEVKPEIFRQSLSVLPQNKFIKTMLTPFMEPLVTQAFFPLLRQALTMRPDLNIGFNTNGSNLTDDVADMLVDLELKYIIISLNMYDRESYLWFTGKDYFEKVKNGIKALHAAKIRHQSQWPHVIVQFLNLPPVLGHEDELKQQYGEYADNVFFRNVSLPTALPERMEEIRKIASDDLLDEQVSLPRGWPCKSLFVTQSIDFEGNYWPCCAVAHISKVGGSEAVPGNLEMMKIGNIFEMDSLSAWRSNKLNDIRALQIAGLIPVCRNCSVNQTGFADLLKLRNGVYDYFYKK